MQAQIRTILDDTPRLKLVPAPGTEQVAPPTGLRIPLALSVLGNVLVGFLLLGGLLLAPILIVGWFLN